MEFVREQSSGDTQPTEIQIDNISKSDNVPQLVSKLDTEESIKTEEDDVNKTIQTSSEVNESINESQDSESVSSKSDSQESTTLELNKGDKKDDAYESVQNTATDCTNTTDYAMEMVIESSSSISHQSSSAIESSQNETSVENFSGKLMPSINVDPNVGEVTITNSALNVVSSGDEKATASCSTPKKSEGQVGDITVKEEKVVAPLEPTILCNSNALNALWDYGILISSDESSDEEDLEQLPGTVTHDASALRQSVTSLDSDSSLSSSLFFTDDSGSDDESPVTSKNNKTCSRPKKPLMTDGELALEDLPPIEDLHISMAEDDCTKVGEILNIVDKLVIVQGIKDMPPLDLETVLFLSWDRPLGVVFDVFGPVVEPSYCVRFNSNEEIKDKNITPGMPVYFGPKSQYTNYVFMQHLLKSKGSDASWTGNNEPPPDQLDFSDDETERAAKKAIKVIKKEIKTDPEEPQRKKHMAYEQRMNAMNLYMNRVSEMKNQALQRKRRPPRKDSSSSGRLIRPSVLTAGAAAAAASNSAAPPPPLTQPPVAALFPPTVLQPPFAHSAMAVPRFAQPPPFAPSALNFNRFAPPPPAALPRPTMFVDTSVPPPSCSPQPATLLKNLSFPPPSMSVPPPSPVSSTSSPFFCNVNLPPPLPQPAAIATNRLFRSNNSVNLNSLFPDLFIHHSSRTPPPPPAFAFPPPPLPNTPGPALAQPVKDNSVVNANRYSPAVFNQSTFHNPIHQPAAPNPPPYSLFINKA